MNANVQRYAQCGIQSANLSSYRKFYYVICTKTGTATRIAYDRMLAKVAITKSLNLPDLDGNPKYNEQLSLHQRLGNRL